MMGERFVSCSGTLAAASSLEERFTWLRTKSNVLTCLARRILHC